ncbi:F0F1 ATP synthase subunit delta [Nesterenkonia populi]
MAAVTSESFASLQSDLAETLRTADLKVADELFAGLDVVDGSASLRRSLTDPAREPADRAAVVRRLFGDKVSETTVTVLEAVASRRWSKDRDLADAVESLAVTAVSAVAERDGLEGLTELESQLLGFRRTVADSHELQHALTDGQAPAEAKQKLAVRLSPEASSEARLLIDRAVAVPRGLRPAALLEQFAEQVAARQQRWIAQVTVAKNLDASYLEKLSAGLNRYFGRELRLDVAVDPSVVGGIRVEVGDEVVDSTVASRLNSLNRNITS